MQGLTATLDSYTPFLLPIGSASDTMGLYTNVPKTLKRLMSNIFVQYLMMYYFLTGSGVESQYALMFVGAMVVLLFMEQNGMIDVSDVSDE